MTTKHCLHMIVIGLVVLGASCGTGRDAAVAPGDPDLPVARIDADEPTLSLDEIELSLELVSRDARGLPKEIRITIRNKSSKRGCLALPRPVIEGEDYAPSLPCLCVGMRETVGDESRRGEPWFLYTRPRGQLPGQKEGVYLDPGEHFARQYELSSYCIIGHGIGPRPEANFSTCYQAGDQKYELRACLIIEWNNPTHLDSNPILVQTSAPDFSILSKLGEEQ